MGSVNSMPTERSTKVVGIRLTADESDRLKRLAEFQGLSPSAMAKVMVVKYLDEATADPNSVRTTTSSQQRAALKRAKGSNGIKPAPLSPVANEPSTHIATTVKAMPSQTPATRKSRARKRTRFADAVNEVPTFFKGGK